MEDILGRMTDTPARLLKLLSLLQMPREWPGSELADRLGVTPRTIRRDVERLRELGYLVEARMGAAGGYRLAAGAAMPPLVLDDEEAVAIAVGLRTAAGQPVAGIGEAALRALAKLEQVLPSRLRYRVRSLGAATVPVLMPPALSRPSGQPVVDPERLVVLAAAIANRERVRFRYRSHAGHQTRRHVDPHRLVTAWRRWYLVGFDNDRADWRLFRVDRIDTPQPTGVRIAPRTLPAEDVGSFVREKLFSSAPTYRAVVTIHLPVDQVRGHLGDSPGDLEAVDEHSCRLHSHTDTLEWIAFRLIQLGCDFTVHQPPELIEYLRTLGARITRAARGPRQTG
jgi:predicted DNA-binding transcriptional regulator YafY